MENQLGTAGSEVEREMVAVVETPYPETSDDRAEKASQSIPSYYLAVLFGYLFLLGYLTSLIDNAMPAVVTDAEAGTATVSEERAMVYLREIVGTGPRVAGTQYHLNKTVDLRDLVQSVADEGRQTVRVDWQMASADYWLDYRRAFLNVYDNVSNIVAVLEGQSGFNADGTTNTSVLFNCHYDTRPTSPGASDNALFCAAMLEVLSVLSKNEHKFRHNIVFLFNGAEENPLQGAHAFLQHPWSKGVTGLVNLDSAGINCKSMLFQVSDPRVVRAYSRSVPQPSAQAMGEALFASGLVPSDTDFRIFRDFAQIYGIDIAFSKMGHVYHTRHDSIEMLHAGVLQHSANMLLALARELADDAEFDQKQPPSASVYWDYLNLFMFSYSFTTAYVVDSLVAVVAAASVYYYLMVVGMRLSMVKELGLTTLGVVLSAASGAGALWLATALMVATTIQLRYLANGWIVVPLYWMPYLIAAVSTSQLYDAWRWNKAGLNRVRRVHQKMAATRCLLIIATIVLMVIGNTGTMRYVITVPLLLMSGASLITLTVTKNYRLTAWQHIILEVALATPALLLMFVVAVKVNTLMLPIMGRSISSRPDYLVAALNMATVTLCALPLSGIELLFSRLRLWTVMLAFSLVCLVVFFVPLSPYRESDTAPALQRHNWFHSEIVTYNQEGVETDRREGIWFGRTEVNTPQNILPLAAERSIVFRHVRTDFSEDCANYTYCNLPMVTPRTIEHRANSIWVDFEPPRAASPPPRLSLLDRTCNGQNCTLAFNFIGPTAMSLTLCPMAGVNLTGWSFSSVPSPSTTHNARPVYFVYYCRATLSDTTAPVAFSVTMQVPSPDTTDPVLDISLNAHRREHKEEFTAGFRDLIASMPDYFNIEAYISSRYNYVF